MTSKEELQRLQDMLVAICDRERLRSRMNRYNIRATVTAIAVLDYVLGKMADANKVVQLCRLEVDEEANRCRIPDLFQGDTGPYMDRR